VKIDMRRRRPARPPRPNAEVACVAAGCALTGSPDPPGQRKPGRGARDRRSSMRAAYYERQGPAASVLKVGELPLPGPGPGDVRVRIAFSGVNPGDIKKG